MRERIVTLTLLVGLFFGVLVLAMGAPSWRLPGDHQGYAPEQPIAFSHRLHAGELQVDCQFCHVGAKKTRFAGIPTSDICMKCHRFITAPFAVVMEERKKAKEQEKADAKNADAEKTDADKTGPEKTGPEKTGTKSDAAAHREDSEPIEPLVSEELKKLYELIGANDKFQPAEPSGFRPIRWVKVHKLPDHVLFNHQAHVQAGVACQRCHGPVETFERMYQHESLSMGWCINCHREVNETGVGGKPVHASIDCAACHY